MEISNDKRNLLFIGPFPPPIHGESVAMELLYSSEKLHTLFKIKKMDTNRKSTNKQGAFSIGKIIADVWLICYSLVLTLWLKNPIIYLSISQSKLGLFRDCIIIYVCSLCKAKIVTHLHGNNLSNIIEESVGHTRKFFESSLTKVDIGIVLGASLAFNYRGLVKRVKVVSNGVPIDFITREDMEGKKENECVTLLYLSNLISSKGYITLVEIVCALIKEGLTIRLNLVGAPYDKEECSKVMDVIKENHVEDKVLFHGVKTGDEKKNFLLKADMMVLPTNYKIEGQPISIIEGMAAGLPIISSNMGAIPDLIKGCGIIIEPKPSEVKNAIQVLYDDVAYRRKLGLASRVKYENEHTDMVYINSLINIFNEVVGD